MNIALYKSYLEMVCMRFIIYFIGIFVTMLGTTVEYIINNIIILFESEYMYDIHINIYNLFDKYNNKSKTILNKYGDCKIKRLYLIKNSVSYYMQMQLNIFTGFKYNKYIHESKKEDNHKYHVSLLFELYTAFGIKFIKLEKNNRIHISETINICDSTEIMEIDFTPSNLHTLNEILTITKNNIGSDVFYNWNLYTNNCQHFVKEILLSINCFKTDEYNFINCKALIHFNTYKQYKITVYFLKFMYLIYNCIDKYILDYDYVYDWCI